MHDWPWQSAGVVPSPELVAAWLVLGVLPAERVPGWAAHWLAAGYDGEALAELAGLHGDDPREVRDLLDAALAECGLATTQPSASAARHERAAAMIAFTAIARLQVDGLASERWVVDKVIEITEPYNPEWITSLPLGGLFILADEWGAGWGRTKDQLCAAVRQACLEQVRAAGC